MVDKEWLNTTLGSTARIEPLAVPMYMKLMDGSRGPDITGRILLNYVIGRHVFQEWFLVTSLDPRFPIVLGLSFLTKHNPDVDWQTRSLRSLRAIPVPGQISLENLATSLVYARTAHFAPDLISKLGGGESSISQSNETIETTLPLDFKDFEDIFNLDYDSAPPTYAHGVQMRISTTGPPPPPATRRPMSAQDLEAEAAEIKKRLALGHIERAPPETPWACNAFFVPKQCKGCHQLRCTCGKRDHERRWVIDYRPVNKQTPQDAYPLPSTPELLALAAGKPMYVKFDVDMAFHLVLVHPDDRGKTAFVTSQGLFQWRVMPMGLKNAPATFQRLIDTALTPAGHCARAFMDDGIIWPTEEPARESLVTNTRLVFSCLRKAGLRAKLRKCRFFVPSVDMLGHILSANGISTDPEKLRGIVEYEPLRTKTDARAFLGVTGYYRDFVPRYSELAMPLTNATHDDQPATLAWDESQRTAWQAIKDAFTEVLTNAVHVPTLPTELYTDASTEGYGGAIEQQGKPLAFFSGKFDKTQRAWSTTDRELYACVKAHEKFGYLLQGPTTWFTDHEALKSLRTTLADSPRRVRWREFLEMFPFQVKYHKGVHMHVDGLTRHSSGDKTTGDNDPVLACDRFSLAEFSQIGSTGTESRASSVAFAARYAANAAHDAVNFDDLWSHIGSRHGPTDKRGLGYIG